MHTKEIFKQLEEIAPLIPAPIYWGDTDVIVRGANQKCLEAMGAKSPEDVIGKTPYDYYPFEIADNIFKHCKKVVELGETLSQEDIIADITTGKIRSFVAVRAPIFDDYGKVIGIVGTSIETTTEKQARQEAEQLKLEQQLQKIIPMIPAPIYWFNQKCVVLGANQECLTAIGAKGIEDIIGKTPYQFYPYELAKNMVDHCKKVMQAKKILSQEDNIKDLTTGEIRSFIAARAPIFNDNGEVIGVVGTSIETTAEKRAQQEAEKLRLANERALADLKVQQTLTEEQNKFQKVVGQMVHDIQSPVSSLSSLLNEKSSQLPEDDRNLIRTALDSIKGITSHMLKRYSNEPTDEEEEKQPVFVYGLLSEVISEKKYEYKDHPIEFITTIEKDSEFSFIKIEPIAFKRMLSNLINNAVDALGNKPDGKIELKLCTGYKEIIVRIHDNGKGMPEEIAAKVRGGIQFSADKKDGHGLGLTQVWDTLNRNNAALDIYSQVGAGTKIILKFPEIQKPNWVADEIKLHKDNIVVVVDDDKSIHLAWDARFKPILEKVPEIQVKHFKEGTEAINFINSFSAKQKEDVYLLTDYELLGQQVNGIDVIKQTQIKHGLLVTSHYANPEIRDSAITAKVKLLPKSLAFAVKIQVDKKLESASRKVDMVWVDDERGLIESIIKAEYSHLQVDIYDDPISFLEEVHQYPFDTKIILDQFYYSFDISCDLNGIKVAEILHDKGYTNLLLISGTMPNRTLDYLQVILKKDSAKLSILDKL